MSIYGNMHDDALMLYLVNTSVPIFMRHVYLVLRRRLRRVCSEKTRARPLACRGAPRPRRRCLRRRAPGSDSPHRARPPRARRLGSRRGRRRAHRRRRPRSGATWRSIDRWALPMNGRKRGGWLVASIAPSSPCCKLVADARRRTDLKPVVVRWRLFFVGRRH